MGDLLQDPGGVVAGVILVLWIIRELSKLWKPNVGVQHELRELKKVCYDIKKHVEALHEMHEMKDSEGRFVWHDHRTFNCLQEILKELASRRVNK